jgi:hypothetical protein
LNLNDTGKSVQSPEPLSAAGSSRGEMPMAEDISKKIKNAVSLNPAGLIWGNINASYERLLPDRHGAMLQLAYTLQNGVGVAAHYRYHYFKEDQIGLNSYFFGGFVKYTTTKDEATEDAGDGVTRVHKLDVSSMHVGVNWGRRWILSNAMNICGRIGYGYPVWADFKWEQMQPGTAATIQNNMKFWQGVDAELALGYSF